MRFSLVFLLACSAGSPMGDAAFDPDSSVDDSMAPDSGTVDDMVIVEDVCLTTGESCNDPTRCCSLSCTPNGCM